MTSYSQFSEMVRLTLDEKVLKVVRHAAPFKNSHAHIYLKTTHVCKFQSKTLPHLSLKQN